MKYGKLNGKIFVKWIKINVLKVIDIINFPLILSESFRNPLKFHCNNQLYIVLSKTRKKLCYTLKSFNIVIC